MAINIQKIGANDAPELLELSQKTFYDAFYHLNNGADVDAYAANAFTLDKLTAELSNPNSEFYFARVDAQTAGYLKLNTGPAQTEFKDADALEVERIYVLASHQGKQIGKQLIDFATNNAITSHKTYLWLGVWENNHGAIKFYRSHGFEQFGQHTFMLGNDKQTDILMKKVLQGR